MNDINTAQQYTPKDFMSDIHPKWCPGCGDHSVFKALTSVMATQGISKENYVVVSGIGCSSRFPYYMGTYGFHSIHGRAPTVAMGIKIARPDLSVWVVTGDGDAISIGGNHYNHIMRRNPDIKIILFNNQIYGLTKGQISPTSSLGVKTKTTPFGSFEHPVKPIPQAIAAGATFAARVPYTEMALLKEVLTAASQHRGVAIIEVMVNCVIYADGVFTALTSKETKSDNTIRLKNGEPLIFGKDQNKGIVMDNFSPKVVSLDQVDHKDLLIHDVARSECFLSYILSAMEYPEYPLPIGIFRQVEKHTYEDALKDQENAVVEAKGLGDLTELLKSGDTWEVVSDT